MTRDELRDHVLSIESQPALLRHLLRVHLLDAPDDDMRRLDHLHIEVHRRAGDGR